MKKLLLLLVMVVLSCIFAGCTPVDTARERQNRINTIRKIYARQFMDDWDFFWLYEENSQLSEWHLRTGY